MFLTQNETRKYTFIKKVLMNAADYLIFTVLEVQKCDNTLIVGLFKNNTIHFI